MSSYYAEFGIEKIDNHETVRYMYGTEIDINRACGYCQRHFCYLTVRMLRQHDCLNKQCQHLSRNENHPWWKERAVFKARRKERKERLKGNSDNDN